MSHVAGSPNPARRGDGMGLNIFVPWRVVQEISYFTTLFFFFLILSAVFPII